MTIDMRLGVAKTNWPITAIIEDDLHGNWLLQRDPDTAKTKSALFRLTRVGMDPNRARYTLTWTGTGILENATSTELKGDRPSLYDAAAQAMRAA